MGREGLSTQAAFDRLRRLARSRSRRIDQVAREVIADRSPAPATPPGAKEGDAG
jgi:AmiR/NasT family two-component response regulator